MIITLFGATGRVGKRIITTALSLGNTVKAFARSIDAFIDKDIANENFEAIKGYVFDEDEVYNAIKNSDAVLSALGGDVSGADKTRSLGMKNIIAQMQKANVKRIVAVGGMGTLKDDTYELIQLRPNYPERFKAVSREHLQAYEYLKASNLEWTFVCPPDIIDGDANGKYITREDYPPSPNLKKISTGNLALFMVNELTENRYVKERVGISDAE